MTEEKVVKEIKEKQSEVANCSTINEPSEKSLIKQYISQMNSNIADMPNNLLRDDNKISYPKKEQPSSSIYQLSQPQSMPVTNSNTQAVPNAKAVNMGKVGPKIVSISLVEPD